MALLGWLLIGWAFRPWLPAGQIDSYIAGLIILAAAPCTAMVFVWSNLTHGEPNFTLSQVALKRHDHGICLRADRRAAARPVVDHRAVDDAVSVGRPLHCRAGDRGPAVAPRRCLARGGAAALSATLARLQPVSLVALLATLVLLFGFQGDEIVRQPIVILLLAVPIVIQVYLNAGIAYGLNRALGVPHNVACPSALIGASNFFELAVAAAIALFGFQSAPRWRPSSASSSRCRSCCRWCGSCCAPAGGTSAPDPHLGGGGGGTAAAISAASGPASRT